jgi:hypothetical protein
MSSIASNPFDVYEIQQLMKDYLPVYSMEFLKNPFVKPSEDPDTFFSFMMEALELGDHGIHSWIQCELFNDKYPDCGSYYFPRRAAQEGILPAVKWHFKKLVKLNDVDTMKGMFSDAIFFRHYDVLEWLAGNGCPVYKNVYETLIDNRYHAIFKMIVPHSIQLNTQMCQYAAMNGDIDILKYLHEHGCPWGEDTCRAASQNGHLECLKYAHEEGCPWDENTCSYACVSNNAHLDCLKYAHENGCPWDKYTCMYAAQNGYEDCLKYALENGCPWDKYTCIYAEENGNIDCLEYALANGCSFDD